MTSARRFRSALIWRRHRAAQRVEAGNRLPPRPVRDTPPWGADLGSVPRAARPPGAPGAAEGPGGDAGGGGMTRRSPPALDLGGRRQGLGLSRMTPVGEPGSRCSPSVASNHGDSHPAPNSVSCFVGLNLRFSPSAQWEALQSEVWGSLLPLGGMSDLGKVVSLPPAWEMDGGGGQGGQTCPGRSSVAF